MAATTRNEGDELAIVPFAASTEIWQEEQVTPQAPKSRRNQKLPERIYAEFSVRTSGASAGRKDWHYKDLQSGKKFRSKKEVLEYLDKEQQQEFGTNVKPTSDTVTAKARAWKPDSVTWVLPGNSRDELIPYVNGVEVPNEIRKVWAEDFDRQLKKSQRRNHK